MRLAWGWVVRTCSSLFAPVTTILPDLKINAVVFGSRMRMMTAEKRCRAAAGWSERAHAVRGGLDRFRAFWLYSTLRARMAIVLRSSWTARLHVATIFLPREARVCELGEIGPGTRRRTAGSVGSPTGWRRAPSPPRPSQRVR